VRWLLYRLLVRIVVVVDLHPVEQLKVVVNRSAVEEDAVVDVEAIVEEIKTNQVNRNITYKLFEQIFMFIFFCII
jgi:hypothetical protein